MSGWPQRYAEEQEREEEWNRYCEEQYHRISKSHNQYKEEIKQLKQQLSEVYDILSEE